MIDYLEPDFEKSSSLCDNIMQKQRIVEIGIVVKYEIRMRCHDNMIEKKEF